MALSLSLFWTTQVSITTINVNAINPTKVSYPRLEVFCQDTVLVDNSALPAIWAILAPDLLPLVPSRPGCPATEIIQNVIPPFDRQSTQVQ
jgi:hypothetical protein